MGLDMYLQKRIFIGNKWRKNKQLKITPDKNEFGIKSARISVIEEELGYWRKANAIHNWFVENCNHGEDNNGQMQISREQLQELLETCRKVKIASKLIPAKITNGYTFDGKNRIYNYEDGQIIEDSSLAKQLLPTIEGFFFGSTDYDQYYLQDIEDTIKILELALSEPQEADFIYEASW